MGQSRQSKLAFVLILAVLLLPCAALPQQAPGPLIQGVGSIEITVSDMDRALKFYSEVLSFEKLSDQNVEDTNYLGLEGASASGVRVARMRLGDEYIELMQFAGTQGRPVPADSRSNDRWFQHIAIVVSNTSLRFYRDLLGLRIEGTSDNSGIEQEHLSGVPGAVVHITSLRASSGPGIELLEYRSPQNGRPISPDERATDLVHREITLMTTNGNDAFKELRRDHVRFISPDLGTFKENELGFREGFVVRDPDGHALRIVEL